MVDAAKKNPKILVLGGGFGGLTFCQKFRRRHAEITLVDRQNHHLFQPLLYQVATAGLSAPEIAQPIRSILADHPNITVLLDEVQGFNLPERKVRLARQEISYDYLVVALGSLTSYFGHPEWEKFAPGLKTVDDALRIRRRVLLAFERAETAKERADYQRLMTVAVVGGGPTGVELAGAFAELTRFVLAHDFRRINPAHARVVLIEASPRILERYSPELSARAEQQLRALGVEVRTKVRVHEIRDRCVRLDSEEICAENIIWAAGVAASPLSAKLGVECDRSGRVKVNPDLSVPGHPEAFVIGDMALAYRSGGAAVPGVAPAAMQMARYAARLIEWDLEDPGTRARHPPFEYVDKGSMATIGRSAAVAEIGEFRVSGFAAWILWLVVHLISLIGFRAKALVLLDWAYSYLAYKRGARIITGME